MEGQNRKNPAFIGAIVLVILALAYGVFKYVKKDEPLKEQDSTAQATNSHLYKDGTYSSLGNYFSPGGEEKIEVSITLKDDLIVDTTVKSLATLPGSVAMQKVFIDNYKALVIGKKIGDVVLDKVSGSSLTPKGWNDAVSKIKQTATI